MADPMRPATWYADPTGRHQYRYWNGAEWTDQVADDQVTSTDPPLMPSPGTAPAAGPAPGAPAVPVAPAAPVPAGTGAGGLDVSPVNLALCAIGAVLVIVAIFLNWQDLTVSGRTFTANAREIPLDFLWDKNTDSEDPSLIVALIPAALLIGIGALKQLRWLALAGGIAAIGVVLLFVYQVDRLLGELPPGTDVGLFDFLGIAPWFVLVGGVLGVAGAIVPRRSPRG